ncbi:hypothetical protein CRG98_017722 [Punica granatum]|uniref:Uncharacterized protein n=1 Tax=Punica granatum TaxID=22663 RepID=A0A2I0K1E2_PUNGR|nr:hypothetical protein CRG98_017722 [Punica granatum]
MLPTQWRVGRDHSPAKDVTVVVTFEAGGQGHALLVGAVACDLLRREGWDSVSKFQANWPGRCHASTLRDMHKLALELLIVSPWRKGEDHERSTYKGGHNFVYRVLVAGLGEFPPSCGWSASSSSLSNLSVIELSVGEVDHAVPEYMPSAFRGGLRKVNAHGLVQITRDRAIYGWGLPTQGCEFPEIERGSLGAGSVA